MKPDGLKLKELLEKEGYTLQDVADKNIVSRSTIYNYKNEQKLKRRTVEKILKALHISLDKFYTSEQNSETTVAEDNTPLYKVSFHQGRNLQTFLDSKGVSIVHFAKAMNVSRPTVYNYFDEKELPLGILLQAAFILNIPVATLKGRATGEKSFEKDVYLELKSINDKLASLIKLAKVS